MHVISCKALPPSLGGLASLFIWLTCRFFLERDREIYYIFPAILGPMRCVEDAMEEVQNIFSLPSIHGGLAKFGVSSLVQWGRDKQPTSGCMADVRSTHVKLR